MFFDLCVFHFFVVPPFCPLWCISDPVHRFLRLGPFSNHNKHKKTDASEKACSTGLLGGNDGGFHPLSLDMRKNSAAHARLASTLREQRAITRCKSVQNVAETPAGGVKFAETLVRLMLKSEKKRAGPTGPALFFALLSISLTSVYANLTLPAGISATF